VHDVSQLGEKLRLIKSAAVILRNSAPQTYMVTRLIEHCMVT